MKNNICENYLIHKFKTSFGYYIYDVNVDAIAKISSKLYESLGKESLNDYYLKEEIEELRDKGYLKDFTVKQIKHPDTDYVYDYMSRKLHSLTLQVTQNCNLRCNYCPYSQENNLNRKHSNKIMSFAIAKVAIDMYFENTVDSVENAIAFYGGEPFLNFNLIKKCVEYINQNYGDKAIHYSITTNATLLTDDICKFLSNYHFMTTLSIDGIKDVNDKNRKFYMSEKSVFDTVIKKINFININYPNLLDDLSLNMVLDPSQDFDKYNQLFVEYPLINKCMINASLIDDSSFSGSNKYDTEFVIKYTYFHFLALLDVLNVFNLESELMIMGNIKSLYKELIKDFRYTSSNLGIFNHPGGPCIPGKERLLVTCDGKFFPCERVPETTDAICIGNIKDGFNIQNIVELLNIGKLSDDDCLRCFAFRRCSCCLKQCINNNEIDAKHKIKGCSEIKRGLHTKLVTATIIDELFNHEIFRSSAATDEGLAYEES